MEAIHWHSFFFLLFALVACAGAVAVVASANIVRMAVYLVVSLSAVAGLFFLAGADFLGAMQLMVYVGGTLVLLVFGVMLTARGPLVSLRTIARQWLMALLIGGALAAVLLQTVLGVPSWGGCGSQQTAAQLEATPHTATPLGLGLMGVRTDRPGTSGYLLPFEIISVHLLVVLIGAAYLARAKRSKTELADDEAQSPSPQPLAPSPSP
ncbi:MAG: NADH-quinone oxidoreductase subunit J [Thermoguttaceae bacterium]